MGDIGGVGGGGGVTGLRAAALPGPLCRRVGDGGGGGSDDSTGGGRGVRSAPTSLMAERTCSLPPERGGGGCGGTKRGGGGAMVGTGGKGKGMPVPLPASGGDSGGGGRSSPTPASSASPSGGGGSSSLAPPGPPPPSTSSGGGGKVPQTSDSADSGGGGGGVRLDTPAPTTASRWSPSSPPACSGERIVKSLEFTERLQNFVIPDRSMVPISEPFSFGCFPASSSSERTQRSQVSSSHRLRVHCIMQLRFRSGKIPRNPLRPSSSCPTRQISCTRKKSRARKRVPYLELSVGLDVWTEGERCFARVAGGLTTRGPPVLLRVRERRQAFAKQAKRRTNREGGAVLSVRVKAGGLGLGQRAAGIERLSLVNATRTVRAHCDAERRGREKGARFDRQRNRHHAEGHGSAQGGVQG